MNLTSPSQVKSWCIENSFHPNRVMGQNFLVDRNQLLAIVDAAFEGLDPAGARILEVGPGLGVMTQELLARGAHVTAVEKDRILAARLAESLGSPPGLSVIAADALDYAADDFGGETFDAMVSNLPYQAGTRILLDVVATRKIPVVVCLLQTEVAERLAAKEGGKARGLSGVWAQLDYDVKILRKVPASCFWPRPAVSSSLARLSMHGKHDDLDDSARRAFRSITKRAFAQRRKQIGNIFPDLIESTRRAEELSIEDWIKIAKGLKNENT